MFKLFCPKVLSSEIRGSIVVIMWSKCSLVRRNIGFIPRFYVPNVLFVESNKWRHLVYGIKSLAYCIKRGAT